MGKGYSSRGTGSSKRASVPVTRTVSSARLHQRSGTGNAFGGYTKVNQGNGTFRMRPTGK